jgi:hypothetical protein
VCIPLVRTMIRQGHAGGGRGGAKVGEEANRVTGMMRCPQPSCRLVVHMQSERRASCLLVFADNGSFSAAMLPFYSNRESVTERGSVKFCLCVCLCMRLCQTPSGPSFLKEQNLARIPSFFPLSMHARSGLFQFPARELALL